MILQITVMILFSGNACEEKTVEKQRESKNEFLCLS